MTDQEQIDALKAQVSVLHEGLRLLAEASKPELRLAAYKILEATPEQCLFGVKTKAIEEYKKEQAEIMRLDIATKIMMIS